MQDHTRPTPERKPSARSLRRYLGRLRDTAWQLACAHDENPEDYRCARDAFLCVALLYRASTARSSRADATRRLGAAHVAALAIAEHAPAWSQQRAAWRELADSCAELREALR
jgi:hypothetical protein